MNNINNNHHILDICNISKVTDILYNLVVKENKRVLIICDIDDTLIRPNVTIGSDVWFNYSLNSDVSFDVIIKNLGILYALLDFEGVEKDTDKFIELIDEFYNNYNLKYFCLTSRNIIFHSCTTVHFDLAGYKSNMVKKNILDIKDPLDINCYNKYTKKYFNVRYLDNICCATGGDKGVIITEILNRYYENKDHDKFDTIIFIDDSRRNINKVQRCFDDPENIQLYENVETYNIHYTYMEEHKEKYSIHDFVSDDKKIDKLLKIKDYINDNITLN